MKTCKDCYYFKQRRINLRKKDNRPTFYQVTCSQGTDKDDKICDSFRQKKLKDLKDIIEL